MSRTSTVYEALGGAEGVLRLAEAWHERVLADEVVAHAFSHGFHPQHTERLAAYWGEAWGGPTTYSERYGDESSVVRMHSGNGPHEDMDRRAIACFDQAMDDVEITDPVLRCASTIISHGRRPRRCRRTTRTRPTFRTGSGSSVVVGGTAGLAGKRPGQTMPLPHHHVARPMTRQRQGSRNP